MIHFFRVPSDVLIVSTIFDHSVVTTNNHSAKLKLIHSTVPKTSVSKTEFQRFQAGIAHGTTVGPTSLAMFCMLVVPGSV